VTASINAAEFIGFVSTTLFDRVEIRESNSGGDLNEVFLFFSAESTIPEPGSLVVFGLGLIGLGYARRRKAA